MRIAITSPERLFLDALVALFADTKFNVVHAGTECRRSVLAARMEHADLLLVDIFGATQPDIQFLMGAQAFGDFQSIVILEENQVLPDGFSVGITRSESAQTLMSLIQGMESAVVPRPAVRGRGRPRIITNGLELSNREYEVATLIAKGYTNLKIAETMQLKEQSIKNLVSTVIRKLRCENRVQVALQLNRSNPGPEIPRVP